HRQKPVQIAYESAPVALSADFLIADPPDARPVTLTAVDWAQTAVPEFAGLYAVVLEHVLSASECATLLRLAEDSVPPTLRNSDSAWNPALVNIGAGFEVLDPGYRNSDRIIWDNQEVVDRLWGRCLRAPGLGERLGVVENDPAVMGPSRRGRWEFRRVNERMRFLKYAGGQFFKPHCDSPYRETSADGSSTLETVFTVHLYLNDSKAEAEAGDRDATELVGGATSFLSSDEKRREDVNPKAGRVLIFQHRRLLHSGDDVVKGVKYTMRTDIMYERVPDREDEAAV
ncbi:hypothetical protein B0T26DRAFT_616521, partial [Lasiosphaeria miniovina]